METKAIVKADEERTEKAIKEFVPNPAFVSAGAMLPSNYKQVMDLSMILAKSGIVPKEMVGRPEACAVAVMFGLELGLSPTQSVQNIMIVNGRPSLWGDALKALIVGSGKCALFDEDPPHRALEQGYGRCHLVRKKEFGGGEVEIRFSLDDAKRAKLWGKAGPWTDYPGRMFMYRARSWACRDLFPDVLKGMQMREELEDYEILTPVAPVAMPERAKIVQDAQIVPAEGQDTKPPVNVEAGASQGAETVSTSPDPDLKITDDRRKALFKMWTEAKIETALVKKWCADQGVAGTADLTNKMAEDLEVWIVRNAKP